MLFIRFFYKDGAYINRPNMAYDLPSISTSTSTSIEVCPCANLGLRSIARDHHSNTVMAGIRREWRTSACRGNLRLLPCSDRGDTLLTDAMNQTIKGYHVINTVGLYLIRWSVILAPAVNWFTGSGNKLNFITDVRHIYRQVGKWSHNDLIWFLQPTHC